MMGRDENDGLAARMTDGLYTRLTGKPADEGARPYAAMNTAELAKECCRKAAAFR